MSYNSTAEKKPKLLDQVRSVLRTKHYSYKTEQSYINWIQGVRYFLNLIMIVLKHNLTNIIIANKKYFISPPKRFILFHNKRHPNEMGAEVNQFLSYLAVQGVG